MSQLKTEDNKNIDNKNIDNKTEDSEKLKTEDNKTEDSENLKTEDDHSSLKQMLMNDINTNNFPNWFQFVDKYLNKFIPPNVKAALTLLEVVDAVTEKKDAFIATGKRMVEVKLKEKEQELDKIENQLDKDKIENQLDKDKMIGGFTYEECVF